MIDLDRRWSLFSDWIKSAVNAEEALAKIDAIPTPADYLAESKYFSLQLRDEHRVEIYKHDFLIRAGYGIRSYPGSQIPAPLVEKVLATNPEITISLAGRQKFRQATWGRFTIGRRDDSEPEPYQWSLARESMKLVCADLRDTRISRNQALVQYACPTLAIVKNTSRNRCFGTDKKCLLSPGQAAIIELPSTVILNDLHITLFPISR